MDEKFETSILLNKKTFFAISSMFRIAKDCFSNYHLTYFMGSHLELIILKINDINEVAVTDPIVRKKITFCKFLL